MLRFLFIAFLSFLPMVGHAQSLDDILSKVDANMTYDTRESTLKMTVTKGDRVKVYRMHSYGRGADESAMEYLEPARDKGTKMLKSKSDLWMWLPAVEKTQKISGHMLRQSMMGSDMSYEDMMQASGWRTQYTGTVVGEETLDGRKVWKLDLKANTPDVGYPRRLVWVDQATSIPLKQELYALSGMLLKVWTMSEVKDFGGRQFPTRMVIEDKVLQNSRTEIQFEDMKFAIALEGEVFSLRWLER
ncbi:MAG: outer membrane lipoprotein-sorting protein [Pseudomonadota bacterium]|nr:outer membrane lipoprotein-sorting protein [Pseudomonadota bacterium]